MNKSNSVFLHLLQQLKINQGHHLLHTFSQFVSMAVTSLSLFPPASSTPSCFCGGGIHLRSHKNFLSIHSPSSSSSFPFPSSLSSNSSSKVSGRGKRFHTVVVAASADYYATLGVPKSATGKEIKAAYRRLARQVLLSTSQ